MAEFYLDSSALVKRYVQERGSSWVRRMLRPAAGNVAYTARITGPEIVAALVLRQRIGTLATDTVRRAIARFRTDFPERYALIEISAEVVDAAMGLAEKHELRGYDSVQLAAAPWLSQGRPPTSPPLAFVSADARLNTAAAREHLPVEDPNVHG